VYVLAKEISQFSRGRQQTCVQTILTASGVKLVQKRRTMNQEWNTFFDSHLYDGRVAHMFIMDRSTKQSMAEINIGVHLLAGYCKTEMEPVDIMVHTCSRKTVEQM
jgi:hypothetical protein